MNEMMVNSPQRSIDQAEQEGPEVATRRPDESRRYAGKLVLKISEIISNFRIAL